MMTLVGKNEDGTNHNPIFVMFCYASVQPWVESRIINLCENVLILLQYADNIIKEVYHTFLINLCCCYRVIFISFLNLSVLSGFM